MSNQTTIPPSSDDGDHDPGSPFVGFYIIVAFLVGLVGYIVYRRSRRTSPHNQPPRWPSHLPEHLGDASGTGGGGGGTTISTETTPASEKVPLAPTRSFTVSDDADLDLDLDLSDVRSVPLNKLNQD